MAGDSTERRVLRFEPPDRETLERLLDHELPGGWIDADSRSVLHRDILFDTTAADLRRKDATISARLHENGSATVRLDLLERRPPSGAPERKTVECVIEAASPARLFEGGTEACRMVQALIDPGRLSPILEVETRRRSRALRSENGGTVVLHCDVATVRRGDQTADLLEVGVDVPEPRTAAVESLLDTLRDRYRLRVALGEREARIREMAEQIEVGSIVAEIRAAREVVVVIHDRGAFGFIQAGDQLVLPGGPGAGASACRQAMRASLGHARARIRLLGTSAGSPARPSLEVWLAEDIHEATAEPSIGWLGAEVALQHAGGRGLQEPRTLRALSVVARTGVESFYRGTAAEPSGRAAGHDSLELVLQRLEKTDAQVEPSPQEVPPQLLLNMELSRIAFDERILVMAGDPVVPLLERVRFLGMYGERRDDFFTTRVARFKRMVAAGITDRTMDGLLPSEQLDVIAIRERAMMRRAYALLLGRLLPELAAEGIHIQSWDQLSEADQAYVRDTYGERLRALVVPIVADSMHPFPHVRNLRPAIAVTVRLGAERGEEFIAVELPGDLPRALRLPHGFRFVPLEDVIKAMLPELYPEVEILRAHTFRVTRSAQIDLSDDPRDMLESVAEEVARRPYQEIVRVEVEDSMPAEMRKHLLRELRFENEEHVAVLDQQDVYTPGRVIDIASLSEIAAIDVPQLRFPGRTSADPFPRDRDLFELISERERFVQFPQDSFECSVERLLQTAADDADVIAIKVTLYRTSKDSAVIAALQRARQNGKDVVAMVELKASFDEQRNIEWARNLEQAGIRVAFSPPKFKVHAKVALVVRREGDALTRYAYIGTGNLNAATAASYVDVGIFTADAVLTTELNAVFNLLTGYSPGVEIENLLVSPFNMRRRFIRMIEREAAHARAGRPARIRMQLNGLADRRLIAALYDASRSGVDIDMMVREICALRPGVPGVSDRIRVTSLLGRWLQHARIFHFHNAGDDEYYIGSADWRPRNMRERVEVVTPVRDPDHRARLDRILHDTLNHPDTWQIRADGAYVRGTDVIGGTSGARDGAPSTNGDEAVARRSAGPADDRASRTPAARRVESDP